MRAVAQPDSLPGGGSLTKAQRSLMPWATWVQRLSFLFPFPCLESQRAEGLLPSSRRLAWLLLSWQLWWIRWLRSVAAVAILGNWAGLRGETIITTANPPR
jgi:hypothetical protein